MAEVSSSYFKGLGRQDYIQKAHEIILNEGAKAVSVRRLAKEMGCSSTTLYRHFENREELLYYAELPTLRDYIKRLNDAEKKWQNVWELYVGVWYCYSTEAFRHPEAYNLLFLTNNNLELGHAIKEYYAMFPEDIENTSEIFREMLQTSEFQSRDMMMCNKCVREKVITQENGENLNRMVCMLFCGYLKMILDYGIQAADIEKQVLLFVADVDRIVHLLASDLQGYDRYNFVE